MVALALAVTACVSAGKKEGTRVMISCPPELAYDATPQPDIPANSTLVFIVDVLDVG